MRVLTVGFRPPQLEKFLDQGVTVAAALTNPGQVEPGGLRGVVLLDHGMRFAMAQDAFDPALDEEMAARVRHVGLPLFHRSHVREVFREGRFSGSWLDVNNHFEASLQFFSRFLRDQKIDVVLFDLPPHEGSLIVLYLVARAMGIRTVICVQELNAEAHFIAESIPEYGISIVESGAGVEIPVTRDPQTPVYLSGTKKLTAWRRFAMRLAQAGSVLAKTVSLSFLWNAGAWRKSILKYKRLEDRLSMAARAERAFEPADLDQPFVYFALHYQPEMTTDMLGGVYADQALAIEHLLRALPEDMRIYVKENPVQTCRMREESFFQRLAAMERVTYVSWDISSFELIRRSRFVATITGTVGFEAVQMGKAAVVFGSAWYRGLPGVFDWREGDAAAKALGFDSDRQALLDAVAARGRCLWPGFSDVYYAENFTDAEIDRNYAQIAQNIARYFAVTQELPPPLSDLSDAVMTP